MLPELSNQLKQESTFVVLSRRIANHAKQNGCQHILISTEASDFGLLSAIKNSANHPSF
jgi:uroporphyrinogen-III synthase